MATFGGIMARHRLLTAVTLLTVASLSQCNPSSDKTPSSIDQVYRAGTLAALRYDGDIRVDRVGRPSPGDSLQVLFELRDYSLVASGRLLTANEAATLRRSLLDPRTYTKVPYLCIFDPEFAFSMSHDTNTVYVVLGTECHQAGIHRADSTEFSNLTEEASKELRTFCDGLFSPQRTPQ
jgi:hypothetical protein